MAVYHIFVTYDDWTHDRYVVLPTDADPGEDDYEARIWCRQYKGREPYIVEYCPDPDDEIRNDDV